MVSLDTVGWLVAGVIVLGGGVAGVYFGGRWFVRWTLGSRRGRRGKKLVGLLAAVLFVGAVVGAVWALASGVSTSASAYPILDTISWVLTSPWTYVLVGIFFLRGVLIFRRRRYAKQAASYTGMDEQSIRRLAAEARSPDSTSRVVATADDSLDDIGDRIRDALDTGTDDTLTRAPAPENVQRDLGSAHERAMALADAVAGPGQIEAIDERLEELDPEMDAHDRLLTVCEGIRGLRADRRAQRERLLARRWQDTEDDPDEEEDATDEAADSESLRRQLKHFRLDLASAINFSNVFWQFLLPALVTAGAVLSVLGVWVGIWWYPVVAMLGLAVGGLNYYRHRRREARKLDKLRADAESGSWQMVSVLVKAVETRETTAYYGWLAGRRYASYDRERFVDELARRTKQKLDQGYPAPSIMEKNAEQLADYYPDLAGFRDQERHDIQMHLIDQVRESQYGLVPKQQLIEETVEHRLRERAGGLYREGLGYDPALVRQAYQDLVPGYLTEVEVTVDTGDGPASLIAVESTVDPLPVDRAQIRSEFSALFREYATSEPRYELPESPDVELPPQPLEPRPASEVAGLEDRQQAATADD